MTKSIDFYFIISEKAELAQDQKGKPCECYFNFSMSLKKPIKNQELELKRKEYSTYAVLMASKFLKIDKSLLGQISEQEYLENTEEN
jgi:hypothetical protein